MKSKKNLYLILIWFLFSLFLPISVESYYFWLKSADNTPENIKMIEENLGVNLPIVSFIFDPREESDVLNSIDRIVDTLWTGRIYHITLSPDNFSAAEVADGAFNMQYITFFEKIKEKNLKVIFRTMHEMNGWRYPWSSNPEKFKEAWIHVRYLSRMVWLDQKNIVFDFSVNHRDMPTKGKPSQKAILFECPVWKKWCYHFEDYYPWDEFVDVVWFTFYNRGKANSNRLWLSPNEILYDKKWQTYNRLTKFNKPIIVDEVGTTNVWYNENYSFAKSRNEYLNRSDRKDIRLEQLREFLLNHEQIFAAVYFNSDYTNGLTNKLIWEADWSIINIHANEVYNGFWNLELFWEKNLTNILQQIFGILPETSENTNSTGNIVDAGSNINTGNMIDTSDIEKDADLEISSEGIQN